MKKMLWGLVLVSLVFVGWLVRPARGSEMNLDLRYPDGTTKHIHTTDEFVQAISAFVDSGPDGNLVALQAGYGGHHDAVLLERRGTTITSFLDGTMKTMSAADFKPYLNVEFRRSQTQGKLTACESNEKNIATALEMYSTDNSGRYPHVLQGKGPNGLVPNYLKVIPTCPSAGADTYSPTYKWHANPDAYTFYCNGTNHKDAGIPPNYPQYNSTQGLTTGK